MKRTRQVFICVGLALSGLALVAGADTPPTQPQDPTEIESNTTPDLDVNRAERAAAEQGSPATGEGVLFQRDADKVNDTTPLSPMMTEIKDVLETNRVQRQSLNEAFSRALDDQAALDIQKQLEDLARQTEVEIMTIQITHLRADGRDEEAQGIQDALDRMASPPPTPEPVDRAGGDSPRTRR